MPFVMELFNSQYILDGSSVSRGRDQARVRWVKGNFVNFSYLEVSTDLLSEWLTRGINTYSNLVPFGRVTVRERQGALARRVWQFFIGWVRTRFREAGGQLDRRRARGGLNLCARESKAQTGRFLREKLMSDHGHFLPTRATRRGERARFVVIFQECTGLWRAGCWLARRLHQLKASTTMDVSISIFVIFVRCVALRNLDLLIRTGWSVICPLFCRERWSWAGDSTLSRSRLLSIWSKEV